MSPNSFTRLAGASPLFFLTQGWAVLMGATMPVVGDPAAIQGTGGTARLVILPSEAHGYRARESVLHTLAEMLEWGEKWTRGKSQAAAGEAGR